MLARLVVERGTLRDKSEEWGDFEFLALPSPADRVTVEHESEIHYLTVICVHHAPWSKGDMTRTGPSAQVVAKWTGSAELDEG